MHLYVLLFLLVPSSLSFLVEPRCLLFIASLPSTRTKRFYTERRRFQATNNVESMPSPLYITIGPPCSGKTTWLREQGIRDVSIDDQPGVYVKVPLQDFVQDGGGAANRLLFGQSIDDRIHSDANRELRCILGYWQGLMTIEQLQEALPHLPNEYVKLIEDMLHTNKDGGTTIMTSPTIDLFVQQRLFRRDPPVYPTPAIAECEAQLRALAMSSQDEALAYGNTNTLPRDYQTALEIAFESNRPVEFILFEPIYEDEPNATSTPQQSRLDTSLFDLHVASSTELYQRLLQRLAQSGRYVPFQTVRQMQARWIQTLQQLPYEQGFATKRQLHAALAGLAGYEMQQDGRVAPLHHDKKRPRMDVDRRGCGGRNSFRNNNTGRRRPWDTNRNSAAKRGRGWTPQPPPRDRTVDGTDSNRKRRPSWSREDGDNSSRRRLENGGRSHIQDGRDSFGPSNHSSWNNNRSNNSSSWNDSRRNVPNDRDMRRGDAWRRPNNGSSGPPPPRYNPNR